MFLCSFITKNFRSKKFSEKKIFFAFFSLKDAHTSWTPRQHLEIFEILSQIGLKKYTFWSKFYMRKKIKLKQKLSKWANSWIRPMFAQNGLDSANFTKISQIRPSASLKFSRPAKSEFGHFSKIGRAFGQMATLGWPDDFDPKFPIFFGGNSQLLNKFWSQIPSTK